MNYFLDTNICIYLINQHPIELIEKFRKFEPFEIGLSTIVVSELAYGVAKSTRSKQNQKRLEQFLMPFQIVPYDHAAAQAYGLIRADLEAKGTPIGREDLLIAAHAHSFGVPLVTNNEKEFLRVEGLRVENWVV
ncbi:MAG: type II toxin-antitoxin system VapC family toxin [Chloroflexota bacterium]